MNRTAPDPRQLIAPYLARHPAGFSVCVDLGGCKIAVNTNEPALAADLREYFQEFLCQSEGADIAITALDMAPVDFGLAFTVKEPDPGKTKIKEEFCELTGGRAVRKRLTGMVFVFGQGENVAIGPCHENSNQVINFVNNRFIERMLNDGCQLGHAAGVAIGTRGLALAGFSGMGKSTLAMRMMSRGATFVSNDRLLVRREGDELAMYGVPKQPRVNPGTLLGNQDLTFLLDEKDRRELTALGKDELWNLERKYDALISECFGPGRFILKSPANGLAILNWRHGGGPARAATVSLRERADLLPAFMKETGLFYLPDGPGAAIDRGPDAYAELLDACDVIEISGGVDFDLAADACREYLETGRLPGV